MKKIMAIVAMMFLGLAFAPTKVKAQISIQINIGNQPAWGPTGYDYAQFYYFPDYNLYYDIYAGQYVIFRRNAWVYSSVVPAGYGFDPYRAYKVVLNQNRPYAHNASHIRTYANYKGQWARQTMIRDSRDYKYYASNGHPRHNEWKSQQDNRQKSRVTTTGRNTITSSKNTYANSRNQQQQGHRMNTNNSRTQNNTPRQAKVNTGGGRTGR